MFRRSQRVLSALINFPAHDPFPRRPARRTASLLARASPDAGFYELRGEGGEMRFGVWSRRDRPDGADVTAGWVHPFQERVLLVILKLFARVVWIVDGVGEMMFGPLN